MVFFGGGALRVFWRRFCVCGFLGILFQINIKEFFDRIGVPFVDGKGLKKWHKHVMTYI
jgi:hypothetical protein